MSNATPMMQQYHEAKAAAGDALLLFRMGDFYELFYDDARTAARVLGIALTSRDKGENPVPMAGFPYHQLDAYLAKIIAAGHRAAICEQVEDPKKAKGLVKREVTRIVTPGTLTDDALLTPSASNFLAAIAQPTAGDVAGLAWIDVSTGRFFAASFPARELADQLARIQPAELLVSDAVGQPAADWMPGVSVTRRPAWSFAQNAAIASLAKHFGTRSVDGFGFDAAARRRRPACRRRGARLSRRNTEGLARARRPLAALLGQRAAGDRPRHAPQPGAHRDDPRRRPRGVAAGRDGPHGHVARRAAAGRLARRAAGRRGGHRRAARRRGGTRGRRRTRGQPARRIIANLRRRSGCWPA